MEYIWRLLVAIFLIVIGAVSLMIAEIFGGNGGFTIFCVYVFFVLVPAGIIKGIIVMIDYHINKKHQDNA